MSLRNSSLSLKGRGVETYNILLDTNAPCGSVLRAKSESVSGTRLLRAEQERENKWRLFPLLAGERIFGRA